MAVQMAAHQQCRLVVAVLLVVGGGSCGGGSNGGSECCDASPGRPTWKLNTDNLNLLVSDTPIWYSTGDGYNIAFTLNYSNESSNTGIFGRGWRCVYDMKVFFLPSSYQDYPTLQVHRDSSQNVAEADVYDAYGSHVYPSTDPPSSGYAGQLFYYTDTTSLMYLKARYYDPMRGGFLSRDPAHYAGGQNLYAYVRGNPVNAFDPSGLSPGIGIGIGIGGGWGPISGSVSCKWQQCNQDNGCVTEGFQCSACGGGKLKGDIPNWKPSIPSPNVGVTIGNDCKFKSGWDDEEKSKGGPSKCQRPPACAPPMVGSCAPLRMLVSRC